MRHGLKPEGARLAQRGSTRSAKARPVAKRREAPRVGRKSHTNVWNGGAQRQKAYEYAKQGEFATLRAPPLSRSQGRVTGIARPSPG
ncbi:hypothetical protein X942_5819 [Burkholderia pseudomallei MSHR5596]|nr:hypothetical protein X942_5819 [Burkholderia pseudomallei MSHR5596]